MDPDYKYVTDRLTTEIRKDIWFFGLCGAFVGYFLVLHSRLKEEGVAHGESWANELFSDFVSFNAFGLVFLGLIIVASAATVAHSRGKQLPKLEATVRHLETRLTQIASSIISFTLGLSALALFHSLMTVTAAGVKLALLIILFNGLLFSGFSTAVLIARRTKPFDTWWASSIAFALAVGALSWLIVMGAK